MEPSLPAANRGCVEAVNCHNIFQQLRQREVASQQQQHPCTFSSYLFRSRYRIAKNLYKTDLRAHFGCINAIEFCNGGKYLASGGDDKRVLIWDIEKAISGQSQPRCLDTEHTSNIFCLGFDRFNDKVFSGGNDDLVIVHDFRTGKLSNVFKHDSPVYGLSIDPQCDSIFATAGEDGQILVYDQRIDPADPFVVANLRTSFHAVEYHPAGGNFLVTANSKKGAAFWDIRKPHHPIIQYGYVEDPPSCMSVRFNSTGSLILALRRRLPPILYNTQSAEPVCTFYHTKYYNSCTMKSCTFAGEDDEWVLSGSDDFNLYVWRVSDIDLERTDQWVESTQMVLYGHRSIVNQVRYNRQKCLLASSGVEKIVKLWSPFAQKGWSGSLTEGATCNENPRELFSPLSVSTLAILPQGWTQMSHDYSNHNTSEDPRMMAFFDSLIQQEIEGWETNSSASSASSLGSHDSATQSSSNETSSDSSEQSSSDSSDDDNDDNNGNSGTMNVINSPAAVAERQTGTHRRAKPAMRRKEHKRIHSNRRKVKVQRHKFPNRIAYLIATKRNTLRRLAIKGASVSNRRPNKIVKVGRHTKAAGNCSPRRRRSSLNSLKRRRSSATISTSNADVASTSAAAAAAAAAAASISATHRSQRRKIKKTHSYETSSDDNANNYSRFNSNNPNNNTPVPSTSTGITSSLKDDIIRLRRQQQHIIDSDDDEDDNDANSPATSTMGIPLAAVQPIKKLNGVRSEQDAAAVVQGAIPNSSNMNSRSSRARSGDYNTIPSSNATSNLPHSSSNNGFSSEHIHRRRTLLAATTAFADNYSSHSNSRLSNSDDLLDSSTSSCNELPASATNGFNNIPALESTPPKRRKLSIAEYINKRVPNGFNSGEDAPDEENNNEANNNNHICPPNCQLTNYSHSSNCNGNESEREERASTSTAAAAAVGSSARLHSHSSLQYTPDSGISVATLTPGAQTEEDPDTPRYGVNGGGNGRHILQHPNSQTAVHVFQQKVARVRRNYRKKFADDSDSD